MMLSTFSADYLNPATLFPVFHLLLHRPHTYLALPQKTANQSSARTMTGLKQDPCGKTRFYVFGFTRNNA